MDIYNDSTRVNFLCACLFACVRAYMRARACVCMCVRVRAYACVRVCACVRACVSVCVRACVYVHMMSVLLSLILICHLTFLQHYHLDVHKEVHIYDACLISEV